jgi:UDP-N-acetylglucosamine pyrophosphorylase
MDDIHIKWYIMTSIMTHDETIAFFRQHQYFGINEQDIFFFMQSELPALDVNGKILMESKHKMNLAPNGNGGIFEGLSKQGALDHMAK